MIILTGAAGFIGSALLSSLNAAGHHDILIVDNLGNSEKWKNLVNKKFIDYWPREKFREAILTDSLDFEIDAVIHLGACSSTLEKDLNYLIDNNYQYSIDLAEYCDSHSIRLIYASSGATYGDGSKGFSDLDDLEKLEPLNPYGFSKHIFDLWAEKQELLTRFVGIKFFNVFGPNEYHKLTMMSMVLKGYQQIKETGKIRLFKSTLPEYQDGGQLRDFIYVKDCCDVILWLLQNEHIAGIYNLGTGQARSWNDLSTALFTSLNLKTNIEYIEMPEHLAKQYQNFTQAEMKKLQQAGYKKSFTSLEDSVQDYVRNYLERDGFTRYY